MVDYVTEIPLPGRTLVGPPTAAAHHITRAALPTFVAGPENRIVAATFGRLLDAATSRSAPVARGAARIAPSVLALFGPSGTGKSHLACGLVRYWQQARGAETACYVTAGDFRREFTVAIDRNDVADFRRRFRERQLLAIDDLHQLPRDDYLVQELRYTLDAYEDSGGTIVVASDRSAGTLANLPPDLRSRFTSGLTLQLAPPETAARSRIVRHVSTALGHALSEDAAHRLATGVPATVPNLIAALFELCAAMPRSNTSDVARAERVLAARTARRPTLRQIIAVVAKYTRIPQKRLKSSSRKQSAVFARAIAVYLARELVGASYDQIGRALGGRDHTTIMHSYSKIDRDRHPATLETLNELRRILLNR